MNYKNELRKIVRDNSNVKNFKMYEKQIMDLYKEVHRLRDKIKADLSMSKDERAELLSYKILKVQ